MPAQPQAASFVRRACGALSVPRKKRGSSPVAADTSAALKAVLTGQKFVNEGAAKLDLAGASSDYRKLFALYQGLGSLR